MALITDATTAWSPPITLSTDEIWQTRKGSVFLSAETSPAVDGGINLQETQAIQISAGTEIRYRKVGTTEAVIVREAL